MSGKTKKIRLSRTENARVVCNVKLVESILAFLPIWIAVDKAPVSQAWNSASRKLHQKRWVLDLFQPLPGFKPRGPDWWKLLVQHVVPQTLRLQILCLPADLILYCGRVDELMRQHSNHAWPQLQVLSIGDRDHLYREPINPNARAAMMKNEATSLTAWIVALANRCVQSQDPALQPVLDFRMAPSLYRKYQSRCLDRKLLDDLGDQHRQAVRFWGRSLDQPCYDYLPVLRQQGRPASTIPHDLVPFGHAYAWQQFCKEHFPYNEWLILSPTDLQQVLNRHADVFQLCNISWGDPESDHCIRCSSAICCSCREAHQLTLRRCGGTDGRRKCFFQVCSTCQDGTLVWCSQCNIWVCDPDYLHQDGYNKRTRRCCPHQPPRATVYGHVPDSGSAEDSLDDEDYM